MPGGEAVPGTLYVVATPLGHMEDMTLRALRVLREVSLVGCEDTRRTGALLRAHGIGTATTSYFEHNERWKGGRILEALRGGRDVALVSDAGTPGISDPGYRLVREARDEGLPVVPIPGPSAAIAALSVSGLPTDRFLFVGFLPPRSGARRRALEALASERSTLVFYESPVRVLDCLADMVAAFGEREAFLCREATKVHEEYVRAPLSALLARGPRGRPRRDRARRGGGCGSRAGGRSGPGCPVSDTGHREPHTARCGQGDGAPAWAPRARRLPAGAGVRTGRRVRERSP